MKINNVKPTHSAFLANEKDSNIIFQSIMENQQLKKLLYYNSNDCLSKPDLTEEQSISLIGNQIKIIPKLYVDPNYLTYLLINFDEYTPNKTNPQFRDNNVHFDIVCHYDKWMLQDFQLRPYKIAAELDSMFNNQKLSGIGRLEFQGMNQIVLNSEFAGLHLQYAAIHGEEDCKDPVTPEQSDALFTNFKRLFE